MRRVRNAGREPLVPKRIFPSWSIAIPDSLIETFDAEGGYWHAYSHDRSISMSSIELTEDGRPVAAHRILRQLRPTEGAPFDVLPEGLLGWAVTREAVPPAPADRMIQGMLAVDGRVAIVTITCDDTTWASAVWTSIRSEDPATGSEQDQCSRGTARRTHHHLQ